MNDEQLELYNIAVEKYAGEVGPVIRRSSSYRRKSYNMFLDTEFSSEIRCGSMAVPNKRKSIKHQKIVQPKFEDSDSDDGFEDLEKKPTDYFGLQSSKSFD